MPPESPQDHVFHSTEFQGVTQDAIDFFVGTPVCDLPPTLSFKGAGVYALYYHGDFPLYEKLVQKNGSEFNIPIYVGKTVPPGWRKNRTRDTTKPVLKERLNQHAGTIRQSSDLTIDHFKCRFVILNGTEGDLIVPLEAGLIRKYSPLWNSYLDGFGNHPVGKERLTGKLMEWDTLHPGREWVAKMRGETRDLNPIKQRILDVLNRL